MTAKRFDYVLGEGFTDNGWYITPHKVVELLNELHEENQELKQQLQSILKLTKKIEDCTHDIKVIGDVE